MPLQKTLHVDDPAAVGLRLKAAREQRGLSQRELAGDTCSAGYVSRLELGQRVPSIQLLRQLGSRLDLSADYLATGLEPDTSGSSQLLDAEIALRLDDLGEARRLFEAALEAPSGEHRLDALVGLGRLELREGRPGESASLLAEALDESGLDAVEQPELAESLARAYAASGELSAALALLERCVEHYEGSGDAFQFVRFACLLGYALTDNGDFAAAERIVARALVRGNDLIDPTARARLYWSQSRLLAEQAQPAAAERYARLALETLRLTEDGHSIAQAMEVLAHVWVELGRGAEALELLDQGEALIHSSGSPAEIAHYALERARALAALGEHEQAAALAMQLAGELAELQPVARGRAYLLLGDLFTQLGEPRRAMEIYELAIECLSTQPPSKYLFAAYRSLASLLKQEGQRDAALELLEQALGAQTPHSAARLTQRTPRS
jgi:tetratricopeptide (TPR) repeat protein